MVDFLPSTRPELLQRLQASVRIPGENWGLDEHRAWADFAHRYQPGLIRYCRTKRLARNPSEEIVQNMLWKVRWSLKGFKHRGKRGQFRAWLLKVLRSKIADYFRPKPRQGQGREVQVPSSVLRRRIVDPRSREQRDKLRAQQQSDALFEALTKLRSIVEPRYFRLFDAVKIQGRPATEVAAELGMTDQAAYSALRRMLEKLRELLSGHDEQDDDQ